jgi:hypothetical protein
LKCQRLGWMNSSRASSLYAQHGHLLGGVSPLEEKVV